MENYKNERDNNGNNPENKNDIRDETNNFQEKNTKNDFYLKNIFHNPFNENNEDLNENLNINKIQNNNNNIYKKIKYGKRFNTHKVRKILHINKNPQNKREFNPIFNDNSNKKLNKEDSPDINQKNNNEEKSIINKVLNNNLNLFYNKRKNFLINVNKEDNINNKSNIDDNKDKKNNVIDFKRIIDEDINDTFFNSTSKNFYSKKIEFNKPTSEAVNKKENINEKENDKKCENKIENKEFDSSEKKDKEKNKNIFKSGIKQLNKKYSFRTFNPKNLNKKNEINNLLKDGEKNGNKNEEINENSDNLNINEIISQKNKEKTKPIVNNINPNNKNYNTNNNGKEGIINDRYSLRKMKSFTNLNINITNKPFYLRIFDKINIFNSILIVQANNSIINKCFLENNKIELIKECEIKNDYCLTSILYYMHKFLWNSNINSESYHNFFEKYTNFINCYIKVNSKDINKEKYCYEIKNIESIIHFIYSKINNEYSQANKKNINNKDFENKNDDLSKFMYDFSKKNKSFISDHFYGFFQKMSMCENCCRKMYVYNMQYKPNYEYCPFSCINFDLNDVFNFCNSSPKFQINNNNLEFNLDNCFNYSLNKIYKTKGNLFCNLCFTSSKSETLSVLSLPNILTIILSNNNNLNFVLQDEIVLKKYSFYSFDDCKYCLISILCQLNFNDKFVLYSFNHKDELWYCYSDGKITQVEKIDVNAIPLVLFYQSKSTIKFNYKALKKEEKILVNVHFTTGIKKTLFFPKNTLVIQVKRFLSTHFNLELNKINLIVNGENPHDYKFLKWFIKYGSSLIIFLNE